MEIKLASDLGEITRKCLALKSQARVIYGPGRAVTDVLVWVLQTEREFRFWHDPVKVPDFTKAENDSEIIWNGDMLKPVKGILREVLNATNAELRAMALSGQFAGDDKVLINSEILCRSHERNMDGLAKATVIPIGQAYRNFGRRKKD